MAKYGPSANWKIVEEFARASIRNPFGERPRPPSEYDLEHAYLCLYGGAAFYAHEAVKEYLASKTSKETGVAQ